MAVAPTLEGGFWRTFHAAHPEVDLVLLPDPALTARPAARPAATPVGPDRVEVEAVVAALLDELDDHLAGAPDWPVVVPRTVVWRHDALGRRYLESRVVITDLGAGQPVPLFRAVGNALLAAGWRARPVVAPTPRLVARRASFRAIATVTPDSVQVVLRSGLLPAEEER